MSSTMKISLLALISSVAAVPQNQYGYGHSKFHSLKPSGTEGVGYGYETAPAQSQGYPQSHSHHHHSHGTGKPYPTGGYPMGKNSTEVPPYPTRSYAQGEGTSTVDVTSTTTTTIVKTVHVKPSSAANNYPTSPAVVAQAVSSVGGYDQCGPATVTVTASERVTVTVEGDYSASSPAPYMASSPAPYKASSAAPVVSKAAAYSASAPKPVEPTSSKAPVPVYSSAAPPPPSPTPSAPSTGTGSYSGTKRGLVYNDAGLLKDFAGKYGFAWNWGQTENADIGTMFVPMMHKPSDSTPEAWLANVDKAVQKGSTAVMGFNECDLAAECNLTPEQACDAWKKYMNPVKAKYPQLTIIGPSVTNGAAPMGLAWLDGFHGACPDAAVDATNIHFYTVYQDKTNTQYSTTMDRLQLQVETAAKNYGKKVWVTEYGLNPGSATADQAATFLKESIAYLDNAPEVQGYSYYKVGTDASQYQLCENNGLSALGQLYAA